ncbi:sca1 complex scaffold protein scaa [Anaeramoeba flamelloides]|uniref:Sca1 complex scaffold protein scaa n=1 Tax=Anaeramoeba flamelloides TaxID=1746091 RepID=A0ABQ8YXD8_9EUKA|nr:sca1 complex scaffold protein scaa [Anaeramoeba flamelloides]
MSFRRIYQRSTRSSKKNRYNGLRKKQTTRKPKPRPKKATKIAPPFFADRNGRLYNKFFQQIYPNQLLVRSENRKLCQTIRTFPKFPSTSEFTKYSDYYSAVLEWTNTTKKIFNPIKLPNIIGSSYSRPFLSEEQLLKESKKEEKQIQSENSIQKEKPKSGIDKKNEKQKQTTEKSKSVKQRIAFLKENRRQVSRQISLEELNLLTKTPDFLEDTDLILSKTENWDNTLIPVEPDPYDYNNYKEYEEAYRGWSLVVKNSLSALPIHANDLIDLYGVMSTEKKQERDKERKLMKDKVRKGSQLIKNDLNSDFQEIEIYTYDSKVNFMSWVQKLNTTLFVNSIKERELGFYLFCKETNKSYSELKKSHSVYLDRKLLNKEFKKKINVKKRVLETIQIHCKTIFAIMKRIKKKKSLKDIGILHGTLIPNNDSDNDKSLNNQGTLNKKKLQPKYFEIRSISCYYTRRNDISGSMLLKSLDCKPIIDKKVVQFCLPNYEDKNPIHLKRLKNDEQYIKSKRRRIKHINNKSQFDRFNTWYHPTIYTEEKTLFDKSQILIKINSHENKTNWDRIYNTFLTKTMFDTFKELLNEQVIGSNNTFLNTLTNLIDLEILTKLMDLFRNHNSNLLHLKISFFLTSMLKNGDLNKYLEIFLKKQDVYNLSNLAYGINYLSQFSNSIFLIQDETQYYSQTFLNTNSWEFEKIILIFNYLFQLKFSLKKIYNSNKIREKKMMKEKKTVKKTESVVGTENEMIINQIKTINKFIKNNENNLMNCFNKFKTFLKIKIFLGISSRSMKISGYYLFLLIHLIKMNNTEIINFFCDSTSNFFDNIQFLAKSKFSHVGNSITIIRSLILNNKLIRQFFTNSITKNKSLLFQYLIPEFSNDIYNLISHKISQDRKGNSNSNSNNNDKDKDKNLNLVNKQSNNIFPKLILSLINKSMMEIFKNLKNVKQNKLPLSEALKKCHTVDFYFIIEGYYLLFFDFLQLIIIENQYQTGLINNIAETLLNMTIIINKIYKSEYFQDNKSNKQTRLVTKIKLQIGKIFLNTKNNISILFLIIKDLSDEYFLAKKIFLKIICFLIQNPITFRKIRRNPKFFSDLNTIIRINTKLSVIDQAYEIWHTFILSHPGGIDYLIKTNQFRSFVSQVGSNSDFSDIGYGLHIFFKLFNLFERQLSKKNRKKKIKRYYSLNKKSKKKYNNSNNYLKNSQTNSGGGGGGSSSSSSSSKHKNKNKNNNSESSTNSNSGNNHSEKIIIDRNKNKNILISIQKDHESFVTYFSENSLFVKLNMLFQKYMNHKNSDHVSGFILAALAKVYFIILSKDYCNEILNTNQKKEQYKDGFSFFKLMIFNNISEKHWHEIASVAKGKHSLSSKKSSKMSKIFFKIRKKSKK